MWTTYDIIGLSVIILILIGGVFFGWAFWRFVQDNQIERRSTNINITILREKEDRKD